MKITITNSHDYDRQIKILEEQFKHYKRDVTFSIEQKDINGFIISRENNEIHLIYGDLHYLFAGIESLLIGKKNYQLKPKFKRLGIMIDCARNGVPNVSALKRFVVNASFLGYSYVGLYLEDCLEVNNEPLFGYMRGRYTKSEIKEICEFSNMFGIEIIPYIQTLAHMENLFHHYSYVVDAKDVGNILKIGNERTYQIIENIISTLMEAYPFKRIHLGMDEAFLLSCGSNGHDGLQEKLTNHVKRVCEICDKYHVMPSVWDDMIYQHNLQDLPSNLSFTCWNYSKKTKEDYQQYFDKVYFKNDTSSFTTSVHKFYGYAPLQEYSRTIYTPAIEAAEGYFSDLFVSLWSDDGAECTFNAVWYCLIDIAYKCRGNKFKDSDLNKTSKLITNYKMDELFALDLPNKVFDGVMKTPINPSKYLLFEDPFYGNEEFSGHDIYLPYFKNAQKVLSHLGKRKSPFAYQFQLEAQLSQTLFDKCLLQKKILNAYNNKNKEQLKSLIKDIKVIQKDIKKLYQLVETFWNIDYKPFGFEVQTIRLMGVYHRLDYCAKQIEAYLKWQISKIEELEAVHLNYEIFNNEYNGAKCYNHYGQNVTFGSIYHRIFL